MYLLALGTVLLCNKQPQIRDNTMRGALVKDASVGQLCQLASQLCLCLSSLGCGGVLPLFRLFTMLVPENVRVG